MPQASDVSLVRQNVDQNPQRIKRVLNDADVRRQFMNGVPNDEKKAAKAFVSQNQESALKSKPMVRVTFPLFLSVKTPSHPYPGTPPATAQLQRSACSSICIIEVRESDPRLRASPATVDGWLRLCQWPAPGPVRTKRADDKVSASISLG